MGVAETLKAGSPKGDFSHLSAWKSYSVSRIGPVQSLALASGDLAAAEDATQEAFAQAWVRWSRISRYDNPGALDRPEEILGPGTYILRLLAQRPGGGEFFVSFRRPCTRWLPAHFFGKRTPTARRPPASHRWDQVRIWLTPIPHSIRRSRSASRRTRPACNR
jgi:hypothetical protein